MPHSTMGAPATRRAYRTEAFPLQLLLLAALIITTACVPLEPPATPSTMPLVSSSNRLLTQQQADQQVNEYATLTLAIDTISETAVEQPDQFHQALTWRPSTACAVQLRQDLNPAEQQSQQHPHPEEQQPIQPQDQKDPIQAIRACLQSEMNHQDPSRWTRMKQTDRQALARARLEALWDTVDPSLLLSAKLARERRLRAGPHDNKQLADLAQQYSHCNRAAIHAPTLASAPTSTAAAQVWLQAAGDVNECYRETTRTEHLAPARTPDQQVPPDHTH